jgi:hypothetical protein
LTPESGIRVGKKIWIRIRDGQPESYLRELRNHFLGSVLEFFDADPGWKKLGFGMEKIRIGDKHPGSAKNYFRLLILNSLSHSISALEMMSSKHPLKSVGWRAEGYSQIPGIGEGA